MTQTEASKFLLVSRVPCAVVALMVVLMVITVSKILFLTFVRKDQLGYIFQAAFHAILNNSYDPLLKALPLGLQDRTYSPPSDKIVDESNQN